MWHMVFLFALHVFVIVDVDSLGLGCQLLLVFQSVLAELHCQSFGR